MEQRLGTSSGFRLRLRRFLALGIRGKIVLPYLLLTLVIVVIGIYVVTSLVAGSLDERLTNQLIDAGKVVSDRLALREMAHLDSARIVAFTQGLADALRAGDREAVDTLARPVAAGLGIESLILIAPDGQEVLNLLQQDDGSFEVEGQTGASALWMVQELAEASDPGAMPRRGLGIHPADQSIYHFTAIPVGMDGEFAGVVVVGTSLATMLKDFRETSLAEVTIYLAGGPPVATSFTSSEEELVISPSFYEEVLYSDGYTIVENLPIRRHWYRLAYGPLSIGRNERLGVFAVALPAQFLVRTNTVSRNTYIAVFFAAMVGVVLIGYFVARRITRPLSRLVRVSQAVAEGDLEQRTGISSSDEVGVLAETFDGMTERLAERTEALEEALGRLRAVLSSIGDGVLFGDLEGNVIPMNEAARVLLEEASGSFLLGPLRELTDEESPQVAEGQLSPWLVEHRRFEVGQKVISAHSAAVRTDDGDYLGTVIVLRDVTAEVEAERLKDAFVTHVSHELRTPLTAIKGYGMLLLTSAGDALSEEQRGFLETINRHTDSLVMMINELLDFSEMEASGRLGLRRRSVSLSAFVEEIAGEWRHQMEGKGLAFRVEAPDDLPMVSADTGRLRWAIFNLVRNAWQATPPGGAVVLRLSAHDAQVRLDVVDTGKGISPEDRQRIFDRFYHAPDGSDERGLGLGLYVTKAIIEAHGGEIRVLSEEGVGSTFSVVLPAAEGGQGAA